MSIDLLYIVVFDPYLNPKLVEFGSDFYSKGRSYYIIVTKYYKNYNNLCKTAFVESLDWANKRHELFMDY